MGVPTDAVRHRILILCARLFDDDELNHASKPYLIATLRDGGCGWWWSSFLFLNHCKRRPYRLILSVFDLCVNQITGLCSECCGLFVLLITAQG